MDADEPHAFPRCDGYEMLRKELQKLPSTWYPDLLAAMVEEIQRRSIFLEGGLFIFLQSILDKGKSSGERADEGTGEGDPVLCSVGGQGLEEEAGRRLDEGGVEISRRVVAPPADKKQIRPSVAATLQVEQMRLESCTCKESCPPVCRGQCGCAVCKDAYADFLSLE